jgi:hypothetical protein
LQLAAEEERRRQAAEQHKKGLLDTFGGDTDNTDDTDNGPEKP